MHLLRRGTRKKKEKKKALEARPSWRRASANPAAILAAAPSASSSAGGGSMAALEAMATTSHDAAAAAATTAKSAAPTAGGVAGGRGGSGGGGGSAVGRVARSSRREVHSWAIATGNPLQHAIPAADRELDAILTGKNAPEDSLDATLWRTAVDSSTGKTYFFHTKTKQTVWSLDEVPVWGRAKDAASGDFYWYNTRNGEVTWDRPDEYETSEDEEYRARGMSTDLAEVTEEKVRDW